LLCVTEARLPIAVALVIKEAPFALNPMNVLEVSDVLDWPAFAPMIVFALPEMFALPEFAPMNTFEAPVEFAVPEK
jgi:hypothetical protein